ncbi:MAG: DUF1127 domain-containing protein [Microvirga sp.]|jgi:uncharacterized protein YjiS (DUF1127 family)
MDFRMRYLLPALIGDPTIGSDHRATLEENAMFVNMFLHLVAGERTGSNRADSLVGRAKDVLAALRNRRQVMRLTDLDDRALKDIGLLRADVEGALLEPLHKDPSKVLSVRRPEPRPRPRPAGVNEPRLAPRHACCV